MATSSDGLLVEGATRLRRNMLFGVLDYIAQPLLMLATARFFVQHLGVAQFGTWMLVLAFIGSSGTLCTGFGDAALKYVSLMRGRVDADGVREVVSASVVINFLLGVMVAIALFVCAPWAAGHLFRLSGANASLFSLSLRIGAAVLIVRSVAFVFISALRGFERYDLAATISALTRAAVVLQAIVLILRGQALVAILAGTALCEAVALCALVVVSQRAIGGFGFSAVPGWHSYRAIAHFGTFSWLQALSGTLFTQGDRLLVGAMLGPAALAYYSICVQASQPIHGLAASVSNVLFPHLSARFERDDVKQVAPMVERSVVLNALFVCALAFPLVAFSTPILNLWMGPSFAEHASLTLRFVALSFALLAFNIPGHYALMALARVRYLTALNFAGGAAALGTAFLLIPRYGMAGAALGRLVYGPVTWALYLKLAGILQDGPSEVTVGPAAMQQADLT